MKLEEVSNIDYCWIDSRGKREIYIYIYMYVYTYISQSRDELSWTKDMEESYFRRVSTLVFKEREKKKNKQTNYAKLSDNYILHT